MKNLSVTFVLLMFLGMMSNSAFAIHFSLDASNLNPAVGETIELEVYVNDMPGIDIWGFDICVTYDPSYLSINTTTDITIDACVSALAAPIKLDEGPGCIRLGGVKNVGTTCAAPGGDYSLLTMLFQALSSDATTVCVQLECEEPECSHNFSGFVQDDMGKRGAGEINDACISIMSPTPTSAPTTTPYVDTSSTTSLSTTTTTTPPLNTTSTSSTLKTSTSSTTTTVASICAVTEIYGEGTEETALLRNFRDKIMSRTPEGREIIRLYYKWSPTIVRMMEENERFGGKVKILIDGILSLINVRM